MDVAEFYTVKVWKALLFLLNLSLSIYYYLIYKGRINDKNIIRVTWLYTILITIICAFRPIGLNGYGDTQMYIEWFLYAQEHGKPIHHRDIAFDYYQLVLSYVVNERGFFIITSILFVFLLITIGKNLNKKWFILVVPLFLCTEIYFGLMNVLLRNGIAMLLFFLAILNKKNIYKVFYFIMSILIHKSMVLPIIVYWFLRMFNIKLHYHLLVWLLAIPFSLLVGNTWYYLLEIIAFDFRFDYILNLNPNSYIYKQTGFRWDFLFISLLVIIYGLYQIYILKYKDSFYLFIFKIFVSLNTIWILIMYANHTLRFFLLSWFLTPLILGYPYIKSVNTENRYKLIKLICILVLFSIIIYFKRLYNL